MKDKFKAKGTLLMVKNLLNRTSMADFKAKCFSFTSAGHKMRTARKGTSYLKTNYTIRLFKKTLCWEKNVLQKLFLSPRRHCWKL